MDVCREEGTVIPENNSFMLLLNVVSTYHPFSNIFHLVSSTKANSGKLRESDSIQSQCGLPSPRLH